MVTFDQFIAEIETIFANYAETGDIDRISVKGWVITLLRGLGKNICDKRESIVEVRDSRALLPENFKSLILALKLEPTDNFTHSERRAVPIREYITNPVIWDGINEEYIVNNCESSLVTEKLIIGGECVNNYYNYEWLSIVKGMQKDTLDTNCYNINPQIRDTCPHKISITNRALNANFKTGKIYLQYNTLPSDADGEVVIPEITTGDIKLYIENEIKIKIAENLILNNKNAQGAGTLLALWRQDRRLLEVKARSESNWSGLSENWDKKILGKNQQNRNLYDLPGQIKRQSRY